MRFYARFMPGGGVSWGMVKKVIYSLENKGISKNGKKGWNIMRNNAEDKGMVIQDIFENIVLNEELDHEFLENFVCAYSYFILKTNKDYKYNQTYLSSYLEDFKYVREKLNEKKKIRDEVEEILYSYKLESDVRVSIDQYWMFETDEDKIYSKFVGVINKERILSNKCLIEVECISLNRDKILINEFINLNENEKLQKKRIDNIFKKLKVIIST